MEPLSDTLRVFKDKWIPKPSTFKVVYPLKLCPNMKDNQFLTPFGGWDIKVIERNFCDDDMKAILSIPASARPSRDCLLWHYDDNGSFNVKSG
ncbi:hypothetical protein Dsin_009268 [Dipteronia sinensis]|uniref:Uncharacterized protein n=1 Tax=Dipteronia sinensis TaxID=43782 RepID=A0AAE0AQN4_9ROSI|nr:hypothetical protein Dsin_009268 [Dipteronia sinensis]